jgi:hypothetical protein
MIRALEVRSRAAGAAMLKNKARLQAEFSDARQDQDAGKSRARQDLLRPLIHENSNLRLRYRSLVEKFNQAVNGARAMLERAGLRAPSGLGVLPPLLIAVPVVALTAYGAAVAILKAIESINHAQNASIDEAVRISRDPGSSAAELAAARAALLKKSQDKPQGDPLGLEKLIPIVGLIVAAVLLPTLLKKRNGPADRGARW